MTGFLSPNPASPPVAAIAPLRRLAVRNGLLLDAERWQVAHDYHRQRQNLHYQALHLPGIVCGLEVAVGPPPAEVSARYRDQRWLQVSPGVAIDAHGNLVVVDQPVSVHLASLAEAQPHWVYLVVRHVDPEGLQRSQPTAIIAETFRLDEKKQPPGPLDIEVCRILLPPNDGPLLPAADVFAPGVGEIDLRYRQQAQLRPQALVKVAYAQTALASEDQRIRHSLQTLLDATQALYPVLQAEADLQAVNLHVAEAASSETASPEPVDCDLFYLTHRQCLGLSPPAIATLQQHLHQGGVLLVELPSRDGNFEEMHAIGRELDTAVADLQGSRRFADLRSQLAAEQVAVTESLDSRLAAAQQALLQHLTQPDWTPPPLAAPPEDHPLRRSPFAFSQWPVIRQAPLRLYSGGGIVLALGDLSLAWAASPELALPRDRVRAAHELGINLLHFAWQRHHWTQIQQSAPIAAA